MKTFVWKFIRDEQGQDLVEYALIVAAVGLALITTVNQLSAGIVSLYQSITGDLSSIGTPAAIAPDVACAAASARAGVVPDLALVAACGHALLLPVPLPGIPEAVPRFRRRLAHPHRRSHPRHRRLPRTDPYSFTRAGQPWFAWEWGADVADGRHPRPPGFAGVALFYAAAIAAGVLALVPPALGAAAAISCWPARWRRCCSPPATSTGWRGRT